MLVSSKCSHERFERLSICRIPRLSSQQLNCLEDKGRWIQRFPKRTWRPKELSKINFTRTHRVYSISCGEGGEGIVGSGQGTIWTASRRVTTVRLLPTHKRKSSACSGVLIASRQKKHRWSSLGNKYRARSASRGLQLFKS